ncbi:MAG TPA: ATP-binding cassette domain-containing protein [Caldilineae bacterium]|nr:ATP-binding cassette domain-containing protein [Caldilineae bacterium]
MPEITESRPQTDAPPVLETRHLRREVGGAVLVDDVTITVTQGEVVTIVGPSGAGKSSLLRLLNRLDEPSSGEIFLDGQDYRSIPPQALRRRAGMLMQLAYLFPGTVNDNIRFGPRQQGKDLTAAEIEDLLARVGLSNFGGRDVAKLSGGEAQRVALARTLANDPELLLLDEPTSALDESAKAEVETLLVEIMHERGLTCLWVTHDLAQAERMATRIMLMEKGKIVHTDLSKEEIHAQSVLS